MKEGVLGNSTMSEGNGSRKLDSLITLNPLRGLEGVLTQPRLRLRDAYLLRNDRKTIMSINREG